MTFALTVLGTKVDPETIAAIAAIGSFVAAFAAWKAVCQARKIWKLGTRPYLSITINQNPRKKQQQVVITNAGTGTAIGVAYTYVCGDHFVGGFAGRERANLLPFEEVTISTELPSVEPPFENMHAVVSCTSANGTLMAWSLEERRPQIIRDYKRPWKQFFSRKRVDKTISEIFYMLTEDINLDEKTQVAPIGMEYTR